MGLAGDYVTGQGARLVIGQQTFTSQLFGASNTVFGSAGGLAFANNILFVADANRLGLQPINHRVLMLPIMGQLPGPSDPIAPNAGRCPVCGGQATNVLGQSNYTGTSPARTQTGMNLPLGVASDGTVVAVADTANNRVLLWRSFPTPSSAAQPADQPADIVLGQPDFTTFQTVTVTASSMRAPQGVWIQNGKLFVADTQNNRVLIWNSIPAKNNQPADVVLGAPNFTTVPIIDQASSNLIAAANTMLTPTSVTSDGTHLFVTDLGFSRVLIWNEIPTSNDQPADVVIGQKDMVTAFVNDSKDLCISNGIDSSGNPTYPNLCGATLNFPRFTLADNAGRLYVADGGNDRVLVFNTVPTADGAKADTVLGEPDEFSDVVSSGTPTIGRNLTASASYLTPTPTSLAWDGTNLYVADPTDFRVLVFTPLTANVLADGVVNAASRAIYATANVLIGGTITADNVITVNINGTTTTNASGTATTTGGEVYTYTLKTGDTFDGITTALANAINKSNNGAGDPKVFAEAELGQSTLQLIAREAGVAGNSVTLATSVSSGATITSIANSATLMGGASASVIAPGTLISILGNNLADASVAASNMQVLPTELGGVQVYVDGIRAPLMYVSPSQINAQVPFAIVGTNSSSLFVRTEHADGTVSVTDAVGMPIDSQNPGIFAEAGQDPRPALAYHGSSYASGIVSVDGSIVAGDTATVSIEDRVYNYTIEDSDTLQTVRDALIVLINSNPEEKVTASAAVAFTRIRLQAKVPGPEGDSITISATQTPSTASIVMTAITPSLCCANVAGAPITSDNPAMAGETVYIYATGLGLVGPSAAKNAIHDGEAYNGPPVNTPDSPVSSLVDNLTASVISAGLVPGGIGLYKVELALDPSSTTNPAAQVTISQDVYTSNIVTIPVQQNPAIAPPPSN